MDNRATEQPQKKNVCFQNVPESLTRALTEQLARLPACVLNDAAAPPDLVIYSAGDSAGLPVARPHLRLPLQPAQRLGDLLAAAARALEEPALAIAPFKLADGAFYPAEKRIVIGSRDITLTERETLLLLGLARLHPQPVGREALLREVWRYQDGVDTHTLETHIYRLRQKIEDDSAAPQRLLTVADGYALAAIAALDENDES